MLTPRQFVQRFRTYGHVIVPPFPDREVHRVCRYLEDLQDASTGILDLTANLMFFDELFIVAFDELHLKHFVGATKQWAGTDRYKVLVIAAQKCDGSAFQFLYLHAVPNTQVLGGIVINEGVQKVLGAIRDRKLESNLVTVLSDGNPVNQMVKTYAGRSVATSWDVSHIVPNMSLNHGVADELFARLYGCAYTLENHSEKLETFSTFHHETVRPSLVARMQQRCDAEMENFPRMIRRYFSRSSQPFPMKQINCDILEKVGKEVGTRVSEMLKFAHHYARGAPPTHMVTTIVGVYALLGMPMTRHFV